MTLGQHGLATKRVFWTPKDLGSALILWLDGKKTSSITVSGTAVSQWDDQSGNGNHGTQSTGSRQPKFTSGTEYVEFGANSEVHLATSISGSSRTESIIVAGRYTATDTNYSTWLGPSSNGGRQFRMTNTGGAIYCKAAIDCWTQSTTKGQLNTDGIFTGALSSSSATVGVNGTRDTQSESAITLTTNLTSRVGAPSFLTTQTLVGRIYEIVVTNTTLSSADLDRAEGYLAWRWGLQGSLPAGHAYKNAPP